MAIALADLAKILDDRDYFTVTVPNAPEAPRLARQPSADELEKWLDYSLQYIPSSREPGSPPLFKVMLPYGTVVTMEVHRELKLRYKPKGWVTVTPQTGDSGYWFWMS